jgi:hypothetical protein
MFEQVEAEFHKARLTGEQLPAEHDERSAEHEAQGAEHDEQNAEPETPEDAGELPPAESEAQSATRELPKLQLGIGQFVRYLLTKTTKNTAEILALVKTQFPEAKTTPACVAWYKNDLRKKGALPAGAGGTKRQFVVLSEEELKRLAE